MADRFFDEKIETLPREQLRKLQDHRLSWQFRRCWDGSEWYRVRFEAAGLSPETFGGLADLERIPLLSVDDLDGLDHSAWVVSPTSWTNEYRGSLSMFWRRETDGDFLHCQDRLARVNWASVRIEALNAWPAKHYTEKAKLRRHWANWLDSTSRIRTYPLHIKFVGLWVAYECVERRGRHWVDDQLLAEIVNPTTGAGVPDGNLGELVVTDLVREANPLVRYRTGLTRIVTHTDCACGRTSSLIWTAEQFRKAKRA